MERAHKMQTQIIKKLLFFSFLGVSLLAPHKGVCQATQTVDGPSTGGIYARVRVNYGTNESQPPEIIVSAVDSKSDTIFGEGHLGTNWRESFAHNSFHDSWPYYEATNSFCGPVELKDSAGHAIPLNDAAISSPQAYPETYNHTAECLRHYFPNHQMFHMGPMDFPIPLVYGVADLAKFQLKDRFDIRQPGRYELTAWVKIYKRSATNSDICDRVDLPPVSINITISR